METYIYSLISLGYFLESEMFQTKVAEKIKTHFIFNSLFRKSCRLSDVVKVCIVGRPKMV